MSDVNAARLERTNIEKFAQDVVGDSVDVSTTNSKGVEEVIKREQAVKFNDAVDELQERFQKHIDEFNAVGEKIAQDLNNIEIMPLTSYVLISPFPQNPFQKMKRSDSGIITLEGIAPTYKSNETGKWEEEQQYIKVGMVAEVGAECKFLKPGDIVFYNINSEVTVPFFKFGFVIVAEQRIIAVVNEGLSQRKDEIINNKTE